MNRPLRARSSSRSSSRAPAHSVDAFVQKLTTSSKTGPCVTNVHRLPAKEAAYGTFPASVPEWMRAALQARGMGRPYTHQAAAWDVLDRGDDLVVVTPTASGKTLCYNVPIATMLRDAEDGCALYLYPTKALSQDQCAEMNELLQAAGIDEEAQVYDGDTPADIRRRVRQSVRAVMTNPDMLHASILPHHDKWRRVFASLKYVVVDEMHTYRGVFGSHVANIFRRLRRICRHYGADPTFVFTSATIANPGELAKMLTGKEASLVDRSGAPTGEKVVVLYNPPIVDAEQQRRMSPGACARRMVGNLLRDGHSAIVFERSRQGVEILSRKLQESLEKSGHAQLARKVTGYRGGYLPEERRRIERGLREGKIRGVVSTNALELGIDIGSLDVCVIAGYPGTIASTWQQAGRAGRRQTTSLVIVVGGGDPVDQYLVQHPEYFFDASPEHARIDPDNLRILAEHLKCAAYELPIGGDEAFGGFSSDDTHEVCAYLAEEAHMLHFEQGAWHFSNADNYPAGAINIRAIHDENFVIVDTSRPQHPKLLGEIDFESAHKTVYENAIYQHRAKLYEVHRLDYPERKAYVRRVEPEYFTTAIDQTRVFILEKFEEEGLTSATASPELGTPTLPRGWGEVRVVTRFTGYKKLRFKTFENIGYGPINLPDLEKHTTSYWVTFPSERLGQLGLSATELGGALQGIGTAMHTVAIVHLMCDGNDLNLTIASRMHDPESLEARGLLGDGQPMPLNGALDDDPTVYLHDDTPGGIGFSEKLHDLHAELLAGTRELIRACPCPDGCPSCVGPAELIGAGGKRAALRILAEI